MSDFAEKVTIIAARLSEQAAAAGTFGVGGVLMNMQGDILVEMPNRVIENGRLANPTAHVERQTVDWYFDQIRQGADLPPPKELIIISSLDPCLMCGGSILASGFNVVSASFDDFAGVNFDKTGKFSALPGALAAAARRTFGYLGVPGEYEPSGVIPQIMQPGYITTQTRDRAVDAFVGTLTTSRDIINLSAGRAPEELVNPAAYFSGANRDLLKRVDRASPRFLSSIGTDPKALSDDLAFALIGAAREAEKIGARSNAAAMVDPFGNALMVCGGREDISPIRTAFMELTRGYTRLRNELGEDGAPFLPHPKHCRVVLLRGPGQTGADLADLGAFGSTMEGPMPGDFAHLQYVLPSQEPEALAEMVANLPPLYSQLIKVNPQQTENGNIVRVCQRALAL